MPVGRGNGVKSNGVPFTTAYPITTTTPTQVYFVLSPVSLTQRDQDGGPSKQRSTSTISRKNRGL